MLIHASAVQAPRKRHACNLGDQDLKQMPAIFDTRVSSAKPVLRQRRVAALKAGLAVPGKWSIDKRPIDIEAAG